MELNDLSIGDWVYYNHHSKGKIKGRVISIQKSNDEYTHEIVIQSIFGTKYSAHKDEVLPIPITRDILIQSEVQSVPFGGSNFDEVFPVGENSNMMVLNDNGQWRVAMDVGGIIPHHIKLLKLNAVHELQRAFKAIKFNKEVKI